MLVRTLQLAYQIRQARLSLFLMLVLFLPLTIKAETQLPTRIHPQLFARAQMQPDSRVNIIVHGFGAARQAQAAVRRLGGQVLDDLTLINAFTARMPLRQVVSLGRLPEVRWVSLDSAVVSTVCSSCIDTKNLVNAYIKAIGADKVWNRSPHLQGQGIGVAVIDSGMGPQADLYTTSGQNRLVASVYFNSGYNQHPFDNYGHGNHVAGIIGGNGNSSNGAYIGVAPAANVINVKVSDEQGRATVANVIKGLQWIFNNAATYNIRVVNISLNDTVSESYHTSALNAAVEALWFNGIVVVVSAGNSGSGNLYAPANDPFVITVGAINDKGTVTLTDDTMPAFSSYGTTSDGYVKPDLVAPGMNIVSLRVGSTVLSTNHPSHVVTNSYFRMSGTSMSAPIVAGAAALILQANPNLTPDQIKYRLKATARAITVSPANRAGAGYVDVDAAVKANTTQKANQNIQVSRLFSNNQTLVWSSATENTVSWRSKGSDYWNSANGNGDLNNTAAYSSDYWDDGVQSAGAEGADASDVPISIAEEAIAEVEQPIDTATSTQLFLPTIIGSSSE